MIDRTVQRDDVISIGLSRKHDVIFIINIGRNDTVKCVICIILSMERCRAARIAHRGKTPAAVISTGFQNFSRGTAFRHGQKVSQSVIGINENIACTISLRHRVLRNVIGGGLIRSVRIIRPRQSPPYIICIGRHIACRVHPVCLSAGNIVLYNGRQIFFGSAVRIFKTGNGNGGAEQSVQIDTGISAHIIRIGIGCNIAFHPRQDINGLRQNISIRIIGIIRACAKRFALILIYTDRSNRFSARRKRIDRLYAVHAMCQHKSISPIDGTFFIFDDMRGVHLLQACYIAFKIIFLFRKCRNPAAVAAVSHLI